MRTEIYIGYGDLKRLFHSLKQKLKRGAIVCAAAVFMFLLIQTPKYKAEASFKQGYNKAEHNPLFKDLFKSVMLNEVDSNTKSVMLSYRLIRDVVEEMGLQARVREWKVVPKFLQNMGKNLIAEAGFALPDADPFRFRQTVYAGEAPSKLFLHFLDEKNYEVLAIDKGSLGKGTLGEKFSAEEFEFIIEKIPRRTSFNKFYKLELIPWRGIAKELLKDLTVQPERFNKNILKLSFAYPDRHLAAEVLNQVMAAYQKYLKEENEEIATAQLAYLEKRQAELTNKFKQTLAEQSAYLQKTLGEDGFIGSAQEIELLAGPKEQYLEKLFNADLDLKRLEKGRLCFQQNKIDREQEVQLASRQIEQKGTFAQDPKNLVRIWQQSLNSARAQEIQDVLPADLQGIDLETAQYFYVEYQKQLDTIQATVKQLFFLRNEMEKSDFELSSLSTILADPVSHELIQKAGQLALQLCEENNRTAKDHERIKEALAAQKKFIAQHVMQTAELFQLRAHLLQEKVGTLQTASIDLIKNEKGLIEEKLAELNHRMASLPEKWRLENELELKKELGINMIEGVSKLAESKSVDHHLYQVESRPLDTAVPALKPQHPRILLLSLLSAFLGVFGVYAFYLCQGLSKGLPVSVETLKKQGQTACGPLSLYSDAPLNQLGHEDLETLRYTAAFIEKGKCAAIIGGKWPDFSHSLAGLFSMKGIKVLLIQSAFDSIVSPEQTPGLWHYLEGKVDVCPIRSKEAYDYLPTGGTSRHAAELLAAPRFSALLADCRKKYDVVLIFSRAQPVSSEGSTLLSCVDQAVVAVKDEPMDALSSYITWSEEKGPRSLAFVNYLF